jgi:hypothetical protein
MALAASLLDTKESRLKYSFWKLSTNIPDSEEQRLRYRNGLCGFLCGIHSEQRKACSELPWDVGEGMHQGRSWAACLRELLTAEPEHSRLHEMRVQGDTLQRFDLPRSAQNSRTQLEARWHRGNSHYEDRRMAHAQRVRALRNREPKRHCRRDAETANQRSSN